MGYDIRINNDQATFNTTRTRNSELWFANNPRVEELALTLLARGLEKRQAKIYAFALEGSHYHAPMLFPFKNRSSFFQDFNSMLAKGVASLTPNYEGGRLFDRRYSSEHIADESDIERQFFYTVLQVVKDGLVERISQYPFYNCYHDATRGVVRKFKRIDWAAYKARKRYNKNVKPIDFMQVYELKYERLPGYENLSQKEYAAMMDRKLEYYWNEVIKKRLSEGKTTFLGREALLRMVPGTRAKKPKVSDRKTPRPRVLSRCPIRLEEAKKWYYDIQAQYRKASKRFIAGELDVTFPVDTWRPRTWQVPRPSGPYSPLPVPQF